MAKKDYPELEGKEITIVWLSGEEFPGVVIGCNYDIGITIKHRDNPNHYMFCSIGPSSPLWQGNGWEESYHKKAFYCHVRMIKKGRFDNKMFFKVKEAIYKTFEVGAPTAETCSFGQ